ncbi:LuxR C-terminal-related transcriptional regulator [uncultured Sphingomonas sp.]|uniref:LuxR C-terminal-related transcriptional regulator n=1 Tax=uncultured Sphingomonas sp. TaxID=158754 RepID=UPI0035C98049
MATAWSDDGDALIASIQRSPFAAVISDPRLPANPIIAANPSFCELTGYPPDEIIGRNCKFLAGAATEPWLTERIGDGIRRRQPVLVEILNYKRDRTPFRNAVLVAPIFEADGTLRYFVGSQVELPPGGESSFSRRDCAVAMVKTLSPRQRQILERIAAGDRTKVIAWYLRLSEKTVKMHRTLLLRKLNGASTAEAIRIAVEAGL